MDCDVDHSEEEDGPQTLAASGTRVYVDGVFDLFHAGHVAFLQKARAAGGPGAWLVVGVVTDEDAAWKRAPIVTHAERLAVVRSCREVDEVVERPPLVLTAEFLDALRVGLVVHGDDDRQERFFRVPIERGAMRYVPYTPGVSTSGLIERVLARGRPRSPPPGPPSGPPPDSATTYADFLRELGGLQVDSRGRPGVVAFSPGEYAPSGHLSLSRPAPDPVGPEWDRIAREHCEYIERKFREPALDSISRAQRDRIRGLGDGLTGWPGPADPEPLGGAITDPLGGLRVGDLRLGEVRLGTPSGPPVAIYARDRARDHAPELRGEAWGPAGDRGGADGQGRVRGGPPGAAPESFRG